MTEKDDFLSRWSRRKQEAAREAKLPPKDDAVTSAVEQADDADAPRKPVASPQGACEAEPLFDLSKLPSLDSIGPDTDIRIFMQPGVPASLSRAALRRAWSADPAIRDFIGLSENAWDFTKPESIPGFGALLPIDDVKQLLSQILKDKSDPPRDDEVAQQTALQQSETIGEKAAPLPQLVTTEQNSEIADLEPGSHGDPLLRCTQNNPAPQQEQSDDTAAPVEPRRRHGGALPT